MEINNSTLILPLVDMYPKVYEELLKLSPKAKRFKNPIVRKTIGKKATLEMVSVILEVSLETIIKSVKSAIESSAEIPPEKDRKELLKKLLLDMHKGVDFDTLKAQFKEAVGDITSYEIGQLEQQLIDEGHLNPKEITKLSDLHVELFRDSLDMKEEYDRHIDHVVLAVIENDADRAAEIVNEWHAQFPEFPMTAESIIRRATERIKAREFPMPVRGIEHLPKVLRHSFTEAYEHMPKEIKE